MKLQVEEPGKELWAAWVRAAEDGRANVGHGWLGQRGRGRELQVVHCANKVQYCAEGMQLGRYWGHGCSGSGDAEEARDECYGVLSLSLLQYSSPYTLSLIKGCPGISR